MKVWIINNLIIVLQYVDDVLVAVYASCERIKKNLNWMNHVLKFYMHYL